MNVYFSFCESPVESNLGLSPPLPTDRQRVGLSEQCEKRMYRPVRREPRRLPQHRSIPPTRPPRSRRLNIIVLCTRKLRAFVVLVASVVLHLKGGFKECIALFSIRYKEDADCKMQDCGRKM